MRRFSTVLVGDAAVTVACGQKLLAAGHDVLGVVTGDGRVAGWAAGNRIACCFLAAQEGLTGGDVETLVAGKPFDLLFSVHNLRLLPGELLAAARVAAINYHDAPLPRYAGLHATSWAIEQGERLHGIVWHRMTPEVDAGELLVERALAIAPDETAWTLNIRCTEAAIEGFDELLHRLARGTLDPRPQNRAQRTYFPGWRLPSPGCVVPWYDSAERISSFVRGLDFGAADNPLGIPKLVAPAGIFLTPQVAILATRSGALPGTVLGCGAPGLEIATATSDVRILELRTLDGAAVAADAALERLGLALGDRLAATAPAADLLAVRERSWRRHEAKWLHTLVGLAPIVPPGFEAESAGSPAIPASIELDLPASAPAETESLIAAILLALGEEIGQPFDVAFGEPQLRAEIVAHGWQDLIVARPPLHVPFRAGIALQELVHSLNAERTRQRERGTYVADLPLRSRRLAAAAHVSRAALGPALAFDLLAAGEAAPALPESSSIRLAIAVDPDLRRVTLRGWSTPGKDPLSAFSHRFVARLGDGLGRRPTPARLRPLNRAGAVG
ncbi:MAG: formyltransferase family protein, partial [Thermoanaerobaculia bacterium]